MWRSGHQTQCVAFQPEAQKCERPHHAFSTFWHVGIVLGSSYYQTEPLEVSACCTTAQNSGETTYAPPPLTVHGLWPTSPDVTNRRSYFFCLFTNLRLTFFTAYTGIGNILIHSGYLNIFPVAPKARDTSAGFLMPTCNAHVSFLEPRGILHSFHSAGT